MSENKEKLGVYVSLDESEQELLEEIRKDKPYLKSNSACLRYCLYLLRKFREMKDA